MKPIAFVLLATALSGCASMLNESHQDVRVQTETPDGHIISDAQCTLRNERETLQSTSNATVAVHRSGDDLLIHCQHPDYPDAHGRAISRANKEMAGNAFFLFGLGATLDHKNGKGYTYPTWLKLVFGEKLLFDRSDENDGEPVPAKADDGQTY